MKPHMAKRRIHPSNNASPCSSPKHTELVRSQSVQDISAEESNKTVSFAAEEKCDTELERILVDSSMVAESLKGNLRMLRKRTEDWKEYILRPLTPTSEDDGERESTLSPDPPPPPLQNRMSSNMFNINQPEENMKEDPVHYLVFIKNLFKLPESIDRQSKKYVGWLFVVTTCYLYNAFTITMRSIFTQYANENNLYCWLLMDYFCDLIYILDIILVKFRLQTIHNGAVLKDSKEIRKLYFKTRQFKFDMLSLLPLDLLYIAFGPLFVLRIFRLLKINSFWEFFMRLDEILSSAFIARIAKAVIYMIYVIHLYALLYYGFSKYEGIASNSFVYDGEGHAYIRCFFFAIKTATSIGKNPKPVNVKEQAFMTFAWLIGVFVFAVLIGQVKDIVLTATKIQDDYRRKVDRTVEYLHNCSIPKETVNKVRTWFEFNWKTQKILDEMAALEHLPIKLQLDIAINVHIQTLSKVQLFQDCDENLLRDLVLKLKPVLFLPGDYVCKKGEVGKEMYIVKTGHVEVMGGINNSVVLVTLSEGCVFGEISLLAIGGANRRTADVRSKGYCHIFVLSKEKLNETVKDYPEAQEVLRRKAEKVIKQNKEAEIKTRAQQQVITQNKIKPENKFKLKRTPSIALISEVISRKKKLLKSNPRKLEANDSTIAIIHEQRRVW